MENTTPVLLVQTAYYTAYQYPPPNNRIVVQLSTRNDATDADVANHPKLPAGEASDRSTKGLRLADEKGLRLWKDALGAYMAHHIVRPAVIASGGQCE